jgi:hypothetical protein
MARSPEALIEEIMALDEESRSRVMDAMISSLGDFPGQPFDPVAYQRILQRRMSELESGSVTGVSLENLRANWQRS